MLFFPVYRMVQTSDRLQESKYAATVRPIQHLTDRTLFFHEFTKGKQARYLLAGEY